VVFGSALELPAGRGREVLDELSRRIEQSLEPGAGEVT